MCVPLAYVARRNLAHFAVDGLRVGNETEFEKFRDGRIVDLVCETGFVQGLCGRSESDTPFSERVQQRFYAEPIAHEIQRFRSVVPQCECEHAAQARDERVDTECSVPVHEHFSVGLAHECEATRFEFGAQFMEVVDGAVENHRNLPVGRKHRLPAGFAQVEDGQPAVRQHGAFPDLNTFVVRTTPREGGAHHPRGRKRRAALDVAGYPCNSAHLFDLIINPGLLRGRGPMVMFASGHRLNARRRIGTQSPARRGPIMSAT